MSFYGTLCSAFRRSCLLQIDLLLLHACPQLFSSPMAAYRDVSALGVLMGYQPGTRREIKPVVQEHAVLEVFHGVLSGIVRELQMLPEMPLSPDC